MDANSEQDDTNLVLNRALLQFHVRGGHRVPSSPLGVGVGDEESGWHGTGHTDDHPCASRHQAIVERT
jgi:hypothetical protein